MFSSRSPAPGAGILVVIAAKRITGKEAARCATSQSLASTVRKSTSESTACFPACLHKLALALHCASACAAKYMRYVCLHVHEERDLSVARNGPTLDSIRIPSQIGLISLSSSDSEISLSASVVQSQI